MEKQDGHVKNLKRAMWFLLPFGAQPVVLVAVSLTGGGHSPFLLYLPYTVLTGPLAAIGALLPPMGDTGTAVFLFGGSFLLYTCYACWLYVASAGGRSRVHSTLLAIALLHSALGILLAAGLTR